MRYKDSWGTTPLDSTWDSRIATVEFLIKCGADINLKNSEGETPLYLVSREGRVAMTELLLKHGADVNLKNNRGETLLHSIARYGSLYDYIDAKLVLFMKYGADANIKNNKGNTPLHLAVKYDRIAMAELLIKCRGDINQKNNEGETPLSFVPSQDMAKLLISLAKAIGDEKAVKFLESQNFSYKFQKTLLFASTIFLFCLVLLALILVVKQYTSKNN